MAGSPFWPLRHGSVVAAAARNVSLAARAGTAVCAAAQQPTSLSAYVMDLLSSTERVGEAAGEAVSDASVPLSLQVALPRPQSRRTPLDEGLVLVLGFGRSGRNDSGAGSTCVVNTCLKPR